MLQWVPSTVPRTGPPPSAVTRQVPPQNGPNMIFSLENFCRFPRVHPRKFRPERSFLVQSDTDQSSGVRHSRRTQDARPDCL